MAVKKEIVSSGWREFTGILLLAMGILGLLSLVSYESTDVGFIQSPPSRPPHNFIGPVGALFGFLSFMGFGVAGYLIPAALAYLGLITLFKKEGRVTPKAGWMLMFLVALACLIEIRADAWINLQEKLNIGSPGGLVGEILSHRLLYGLMGSVGAAILSTAVLIASIVLLFDIHPLTVGRHIAAGTTALIEKMETWRKSKLDEARLLEEESRTVAKRRRQLEEAVKDSAPVVKIREKAKPQSEPEEEIAPVVDEREADAVPVAAAVAVKTEEEDLPAIVRRARDKLRAKLTQVNNAMSEAAEENQPAVAVLPAGSANFTLPPISLLDELPPGKDREIKADFSVATQILKDTLNEFGIEVEITNVERGPVVTRYELLPAPGVRVEKIQTLSNNIALALKAESIRVQAPIPGKGVVGIEVPNPKTTMVFLREILETEEWTSGRAALPLVLGKDVGGHTLIADLADMPHLLIAGATGSGKTVCMNSILAGLLMSRTPDQMRLMLIDPKIVEFSQYNSLPHLVVPVVTDAKKVALALRWAINEMEKRYKLFAKVGVRNIKGFNSRPIAKQPELFGAEGEGGGDDSVIPPFVPESDSTPDRVPYIVIVIDELADLMLVAQTDIETSIARLAQLSRAVGIHMIIATQRPSVNVITGTIKANFPARIAFQVAQKVDSRTILDAIGADKLLGKGDMLFLPPGSSKLIRAQGTFTADPEIHRIVEHLKAQGAPQFEMSIKDKIDGKSVDLPDMEEDDELIEAALEIIRQTRRASTSSLQRRLRIGYTRAARIMDLLEQRGVVGPAQGSDPREILVDLDGDVPQNAEAKAGPPTMG